MASLAPGPAKGAGLLNGPTKGTAGLLTGNAIPRNLAPYRPVVPMQLQPRDTFNGHPVNLTQAPAGGGASPSPAPKSSGSNELDATYYQNVAANQAKINSQIDALNQQQGFGQVSLQNTLGQLHQQEPLAALRAEQGANNRGALFSTVYGQQQGQLHQGYLDRENAAQDNFQKLAASVASRTAAAQEGGLQFNSGEALSSALRAVLAAQNNPALGQPTPATPAPATPAAKPPSALAKAIAASNKRPVVPLPKQTGRSSKMQAFLSSHPKGKK